MRFSALPSGLLGLAALVDRLHRVAAVPAVVASARSFAQSTGLPINAISDDVLHFADFAYLIGFVVAALVYWIGWRMTSRSADHPMVADRG